MQPISKNYNNMENLSKSCEQLMIDFAKRENLSPQEMLSGFQTALLNIAGWVCQCYGYSDEEYEKFMMEYVDNVRESVEFRFKRKD